MQRDGTDSSRGRENPHGMQSPHTTSPVCHQLHPLWHFDASQPHAAETPNATYLRRPCICTRSVRRASACAQTAVGQSDRRQLRVVTAARSVLRAVLHMPCTPAARCLGGGVAASHALRSAVTMLRRDTPRCDIVRRVATWHKIMQHNTACCNTCSTVQHVATQYDMPEYLVSPPSQSLR
jgi:hypothetical protein